MVKDAEVRVRQALSKQLKDSDSVPHDVALSLARDVDDVSLPMLEFSSVLSDEDLVEIVASQDESKQVAIAKRGSVSEKVSEALVETKSETVVASLVENEGAEISENALQKVVEEFGSVESIQAPLVHRERLPITVAERLVSRVSEALQEHLVTHHELSPGVASDLILHSREKATLGLITPWSSERDVEQLIRTLQANKRLTPTIILRALCMGDVGFFEAAMAALSRVPLVNARLLIHDKGEIGFKAMYDKAKMPQALFMAFRSAIDVFNEMEFTDEPNDREQFARRLLERLLTQFEEMGMVEDADMEYLLAKFNKIADESQDAA